jgi:hypothetical protein
MEHYKCQCGIKFYTAEAYLEHLRMEIINANLEEEPEIQTYYNKIGQ